MQGNSAYAEISPSRNIPAKEREIYEIVLERWPATALDIAEHFSEALPDRGAKKRASTKYSYYLRKLIARKMLMSKRAGNSLIVWPVHAEKYRTIHTILQE